jgi:large subunit ribosomal protein L24e
MKPGHGITFVTIDSKVLHFCSSKCRKNFKMGRKKRKWTTKKKEKKEKEKEKEKTEKK